MLMILSNVLNCNVRTAATGGFDQVPVHILVNYINKVDFDQFKIHLVFGNIATAILQVKIIDDAILAGETPTEVVVNIEVLGVSHSVKEHNGITNLNQAVFSALDKALYYMQRRVGYDLHTKEGLSFMLHGESANDIEATLDTMLTAFTI